MKKTKKSVDLSTHFYYEKRLTWKERLAGKSTAHFFGKQGKEFGHIEHILQGLGYAKQKEKKK